MTALNMDAPLEEYRTLAPRVIHSPFVRDDEVILMNDLGLPIHYPLGWAEMTAIARLRWGIEHGMAVLVGDRPGQMLDIEEAP